MLAASVEGHRFSDVLDQEGLLGGNTDDVVLRQLPVLTADAFAAEPQPCSRTCVAVVHHEASLLVLDFGVIGADALIGEPNMTLLGLADAHSVVVLEDGSVGRLVFGLLELEFDHSFVDVLL